MKSTFVKGDIVKTADKISKKIRKGKIQDIVIENGTVIGNEHFGRIVKVKTADHEIVSTKPEYLELV